MVLWQINKWRIFHRPLDVTPQFCDSIVKVCCILQNFVRRKEPTIRKYQHSVVDFLSNEEHIYFTTINVNISIFIKDIKRTLLTFFVFLRAIHLDPPGNDHFAHFSQNFSFKILSVYSFTEQSYSAGRLSISVISISQSYTYLKAITKPNSVRYTVAVPQGNGLGSAERETIVVGARSAINFFLFHLYKLLCSDNPIALETEHVATLSSPRLNRRPCAHCHIQL